MPIYEYDCQKCGTFEVSQKITEPALTTHDVCGGPVQRRISLTSFALKGGGWYADGYSTPASKKTESGPTGSGNGSSGSGQGCGSGACGSGSCAN
jgi:putative FmdB family regulatory protein